MTIKLSYEYSKLDKQHQFGIESFDDEGKQAYVRWVWFYLGKYLSDIRINESPYKIQIHPYRVGRVLRTYQFSNNARHQARLIANRIDKIINKNTM